MIDQQLVEMLDDPNPQVRADAVKQLAKTKSQDAVRYLATVYKTDNDAEVRELARKAGLYIKKKMTEDNWTGGEATTYDEPDAIPDEVPVSPRAVESSKGNMDTAMNLHVSGDDDKAANFVQKAFKTNPNLKNDPYYLGMAATILGIPGDQVTHVLLGDYEYDTSGKPKRKRKSKDTDDVSTEKVIIDLVIFWIVITATLIIGALILFQVLSGVFDELLASPEFTQGLSGGEIRDVEDQINLFMNVFLSAGLVSTVIYSGINGIFSVISLLIMYAFVHFSASSILSGEGTFKGLIHRLTNFFTISYVLSAIVGYFMVYQLFTGMANYTGEDPSLAIMQSISTISGLATLAYIVWLFILGYLIGKNYKFGTGKGCMSVIISWVLLAAISCACGFVFSAVAGQMMNNIMLSASNGF